MTISPRFAYIQARIQSRYGERPGTSDWTSLRQIQGFGQYMQQARAIGFAPWLEKLGLNSNSHAVEIALREAFRHTVAEVGAWMPVEWRLATLWFALVIDLEPIRIIASGEAAPDWFRDDPFLGALVTDTGSWPLPLLAPAVDDETQLALRWQTLFAEYAPAMPPPDGRRLAAFRSQLPISSYDKSVMAGLDRSFRRFAGTPLAVFSFLALVLCDLLHLRGELLRRLEFPVRAG